MIPRVGDKDVALAVDGDSHRFLELTVARTLGAPSDYDFAISIELLDPVVSRVGDKERPGSV